MGIERLKYLVLISILLVFCSNVFAYTIIHPEKKEMNTYESGIFFCGNLESDEKLYINNQPVITVPNGAFAQNFSLNQGINIFKVEIRKDNTESKIVEYKITRIIPKYSQSSGKLSETIPKWYTTTKDNVILRSTPIDAGINRMGYLPSGTKVLVNGSKSGFSRIKLSPEKYGWIISKDLKPTEVLCTNNILKTEENLCEEDEIFTVYLNENSPYSEFFKDNILTINIYNNCGQTCFSKTIEFEKIPRYSVKMKDNRLSVVKLNDNKSKTIVIDAGHGGGERGAIGCFGDKEKDLNLEVSKKLKEMLVKKGYNVLMTREDDEFVSLSDRAEFGKKNGAVIFISIHLNSVPYSCNPNDNEGTVSYYYNPQSKEFASIVQEKLSSSLNTKNNGIRQASFAVIRPTEYIGVLAELAYLVNPKDTEIYKSENFSEVSAKAIFEAIEEYFLNNK